MGVKATPPRDHSPESHLPGLAASPARIRRDPQRLAAGLLGQEGELTHGAADEGPQVDGGALGLATAACWQQEEESGQDHTLELHAVAEGRGVKGWESQDGGTVLEARSPSS